MKLSTTIVPWVALLAFLVAVVHGTGEFRNTANDQQRSLQGEEGGEQGGEEGGPEDEQGAQGESQITVVANEDGSMSITITTYDAALIEQFFGTPSEAPSPSSAPSSYIDGEYYAYNTASMDAGKTMANAQGRSKADTAWIVGSAMMLAGLALVAYKHFHRTKKTKADALVKEDAETPYKNSDVE